MFTNWKQIIIIIGLSIITGTILAASFQVLEELPDYVKVRFTLPAWKIESVRQNNQQWQKISCEQGNAVSKEGFPLLKSFSEAIGIPVDGDINIEIVSQKKENHPDIKLYPCERIDADGTNVKYSFYQDLKAYRSTALYPAVFANKGNSAFIGDRNMIAVQLFPFQYNAASRELMVTTEAELVIHITGNKSQSRDYLTSSNYIDSAANTFFLNNRTSQVWRKAKDVAPYISRPRDVTNSVSELQLVIDEEGIYKITYQYLRDKMLYMEDSLGVQYSWSLNNIDPRYLQLNDEFGAIAIHFSGEEDGSFDENDFFEFYGDRHYGDDSYQDDYTAENVYTLSLQSNLGSRMAVENGGLTISNAAQYIVPDAYEQTIHLEQQLIPDKLGRSWSSGSEYYREDLWFWRKITAPNLDIIPFELQYPMDTTIRTFSTKVSLFGLTYLESLPLGQYDHKATIRLNQALIGTNSWRDQTEKIFENENPIPNSYLHNGTNYYYISLNGDTPMGDREQIMLDYIELKYWRRYKTSEDFIRFSKPSNRPFGLYQFKVEGFTTEEVSLYKIGSSVFNNLQIEPFSLDGGQPWTVTFQDSVLSNDVKYFAVTEQGKKLPKDFRVNIPSYWHTSDNAADCLILTKGEFVDNEGTQLYKQVWEDRGYQVQVVDVQDIYDEFNSGIKSATAIKDMLKYAYNNWQEPQLRSVILLGDGTDDERDNSTSRKYNVVPVKKIWTYKHGATASDNWYGCLVGNDPVPEVSVSRINIWKPEQIISVAQKSQYYNSEPNFDKLWHGHIVLASGGKTDDNNDIFAQQSESVRSLGVPDFYRVSRVYATTLTVSPEYAGLTAPLINNINTGTIFLQFMGHGGGRIWADYDLFNFTNVSSLNNQNYPIVSSLACYCSAFDTNGSSSISEALVLQPGKGAIATVGFSGLGYLYEDLDFGIALTEGLFIKDFNSLGDAFNYTKAKFYVTTSSSAAQQALTQGCAILGDTNIRVIKPHTNVIVNTDKDRYSVGDTLHVSATMPTSVNAARTYVMKSNEIVSNTPFDLPVLQGTYISSYILPGTGTNSYQNKVMVTGFSDQGEYYGSKEIAFGRGLVSHLQTYPEKPVWSDSVSFSAKVNGFDNLSSVVCRVRTDSTSFNPTWVTIPMMASESDTTIYETVSKLAAQSTGKPISFKYRVTTTGKSVYESKLYSYTVAGPELLMADMQFIAQESNLAIKVLVKNVGDAPSPPTLLKLIANRSGYPALTLKSITFDPLADEAQRWVTMAIDTLLINNVTFEAKINIPRLFPEWSPYDGNNILTLTLPMNYYSIGQNGGSITSLDGNIKCEIPANLVPTNENSLFYINTLASVTAKDEPDVYPVLLKSAAASLPYEVRAMDTSLADSSGIFYNGKKIKLTFYYNTTDPITQSYENENSYRIFRWEPDFKKWVMQGGNISIAEDKVVYEVNRQGIYSLLRSMDNKKPSIDVNVQDQEFTVGGYISGTGIISLVLSDANGIDVFDNSIRLFLDGEPIPENLWVKTVNQDDINRIPIKYQLNLPKGVYTLVVDCKDVNGNFNTRDIQFIVNDEFDVIRLANYPNPVLGSTVDPKNAGRTRFTYVLTDDADEVTIKIFTVSGRLVKTFKNLPYGVGYHEYPRTVYAWDCTDDKGFTLANGVYFYNLIAKKGSKTVEKTQKLAITK